jgi:hypothetical protein
MPRQPDKVYIRFISPPYFAFNKKMQRAQSVLAFVEHVPYPFDSGNEVHADVILDGVCYSAVGSAPDPCVLKGRYAPNPYRNTAQGEELVPIPIADPVAAKMYLEAAAKITTIRYSIPFTDFVTPNVVLNYTDPDLDCHDPTSWPTMFCSQFALLFLRHCHSSRILGPLDPARADLLYACNSHVCSPAHLRKILHGVLDTK